MVTGKVQWRRARVRQRLDNMSSTQLIIATEDMMMLWHHMVANVIYDDRALGSGHPKKKIAR